MANAFNIQVDPKEGFNPCRLLCARCGKQTSHIVILDKRKYKAKCDHCGNTTLGVTKAAKKCQFCGNNTLGKKVKLPKEGFTDGVTLCNSCKAKQDAIIEEIETNKKILKESFSEEELAKINKAIREGSTALVCPVIKKYIIAKTPEQVIAATQCGEEDLDCVDSLMGIGLIIEKESDFKQAMDTLKNMV